MDSGLLWYLKKYPNEKNTKMAEAFFQGFKFSIFIHPEDANDPAHQICLLTMVNVAARISISSISVQVFGIKNIPRNDHSGLNGTLDDAITELGGCCLSQQDTKDTLGIVIGRAKASACRFYIRAVFDGWRGGIIPYEQANPFQKSKSKIPLGAIFSAGLAVYECFRFHNEEGSAIGHMPRGLSLWNLRKTNWTDPCSTEIQDIEHLSPIWFCGLGHLGQAYIWILGHLSISPELKLANQITLQDGDKASISNLSTSLLTTNDNIGVTKTHICNDWLSQRGFQNIVDISSHLTADSKINFSKSQVVCGFDNKMARRQVALKKPCLMIDGGIGGKPDDFQCISMTVLPSDIDPKKRWAGNNGNNFAGELPESLKLLEKNGVLDKCGLLTLNGKAVGFPFVGTVAGAIIVAELIKRNNNGPVSNSLSIDLRNVNELTVK